ncbi:PKD domain-containing protein, partial [bacterium]
MNLQRTLNFGSCIPTFTDWEFQPSIIVPEDESGASPGMAVWDDKIYIAWNNNTGDGTDYESQLYCTIGNEPGQNWLTGQGSYGPIYSESTGDPHTRVSPYSDGHVLYLNGRRLESRFSIYNGENWSMTRTAPWVAGYPNVDTNGQTVWVVVGSNSSASDEVSITGIRKPDAEPFDFENPAPQVVFDIDTLEAEVDQTFQYDLNLLEFGAQSLTISQSSETPLLDGMNLNSTLNTFSWTPQASQMAADPWGEGPGLHLFGVTLTNTYNKSVTLYFWIQVVNANQAPLITSTPVNEVAMGEPYTYTVIATDPDGDALTFDLGPNPDGMSIHAQTGVISWTTDQADEGVHDVTVIVTDARGDFATQSFTVNVVDLSIPAPTALFIANVTEGIYPLEVAFTDQSTGNINAYAWDFGDFETSSDQNPVHLFQAAGVYTVRLIVSGPGGADTLTIQNGIQVMEPLPVAGFTVDPTSGTVPLTVQFTDTSQGAIISWQWDFGDGNQSSIRHPEHTYTESGWYSVLLKVAGPGGIDSTWVENVIQVGTTPPIAAFSQDTTWGSPPLTVQFMDQSQGDVDSYLWDFGDDTENSLLQNPEHTFIEDGIYSVSLKVTGPGGSDSVTVENLIQVGIPKPIAVFAADTTWGDAPLTVQFTDWSQGEIDSYEWDFGDGDSSVKPNPLHLYQYEGNFTVRLTVTGPGGSDTLTINQMINAYPVTVVADETIMPDQFNLYPNTPNPFNPSTQISFDLPQSEQVKISVFDLRGHRIVVLKDGLCSTGQHSVVWNG